MGEWEMSQLATWVLVSLCLVMALSLYRILWGPTNFDRLTGLGLVSTKTILVLVLVGFVTHKVSLFVDIALAYSSIAYIGTLILAKYFEEGKGIDT